MELRKLAILLVFMCFQLTQTNQLEKTKLFEKDVKTWDSSRQFSINSLSNEINSISSKSLNEIDGYSLYDDMPYRKKVNKHSSDKSQEKLKLNNQNVQAEQKHPDFLYDLEHILKYGTDLSNYWLMVRSFIERVVAYLEEENALFTIRNKIPLKLYDGIVVAGDGLNLLKSWHDKLSPDFLQHVSHELDKSTSSDGVGIVSGSLALVQNTAESVLGSEAVEEAVNGILDYVSQYIIQAHSREAFEDYLTFLVPNNTLLFEIFHDGMPKSQHDKTGVLSRKIRQVKNDITYNRQQIDPYKPFRDTRQYLIERDGGYGGGGGHGGGGYGGGGGYHGMMMMPIDPFLLLASLALGALLGFLIAALTASAAGRSIGDDSLMLWLSDLPNTFSYFFKSNSTEDADKSEDRAFKEHWDSVPHGAWNKIFVLGEEDPADILNGLWNAYRKSQGQPVCIEEFLCEEISALGPEVLVGTQSLTALLMSSASGILGAHRPGQLLDGIGQSLFSGHHPVCPWHAQCL